MCEVATPPESGKRLKADICTSLDCMKSMDGSYSSSAKFSALTRRKMLAQRHRTPGVVPVVSEIKQRVNSARLLRMKQLQNNLGELHHRIAELTAENRLLKVIHKRQESAISKYESSSAELPQLLQSHAEELRMWQTRSRNLQKQNKEFQDKIKQKDQMIITLTDQNRHLLQLNKDKHLEERERLNERVKELEQRLVDKDNDMKLLARRLQLEAKTFKSQLHNEQQKYREVITKLDQAQLELSRINGITSDLNGKRSPRLNRSINSGNKQMDRLKPSKSQNSIAHSNSSSNIENSLTPTLPSFFDSAHEQTRDEKKLDETEFLKQENENFSSVLKNGSKKPSNKSQIPKPTKLSPIHKKSASKKSLDSDISLEDDGSDEFLFFSENSDIKTEAYTERNSKKIDELLEHKKHIDELASKMSRNTLEVPEIEHKIRNRETVEITDIEAEVREAMLKHESLLDSFIDDFSDEPVKSKKSEINNELKQNSNKKSIDPKKKKSLLAALKEIDGNDASFDK